MYRDTRRCRLIAHTADVSALSFCSIVSYFLGKEKRYAIISNNLPGVTTSYSFPSCCTTCLRSEGVIVHAIMYTFKYWVEAFLTRLTVLLTLSARPRFCNTGTPDTFFQLDCVCPEPLSIPLSPKGVNTSTYAVCNPGFRKAGNCT